ncbi:hypothetical protein CYMTET_52227 [Cymbomonas tetramitiformis]|uniref:Uncharacterized protein n=1 Tax=Cymbomonas tetramitiformis TaxID=36881 RepID=A0AAE0BJE4_9CHLO|nr:hypothetical protein CYMTET_52227 [Cymbomonas tetramitiformis]
MSGPFKPARQGGRTTASDHEHVTYIDRGVKPCTFDNVYSGESIVQRRRTYGSIFPSRQPQNSVIGFGSSASRFSHRVPAKSGGASSFPEPAPTTYEAGKSQLASGKAHYSTALGLPHIYQASTNRMEGLRSVSPSAFRPLVAPPERSKPLSRTSYGMTPDSNIGQAADNDTESPNIPSKEFHFRSFSTSPSRHETPWHSKNNVPPMSVRRPMPSLHDSITPDVEFPSVGWFKHTIPGMRDALTPNTMERARRSVEEKTWYPNPAPRTWFGGKNSIKLGS